MIRSLPSLTELRNQLFSVGMNLSPVPTILSSVLTAGYLSQGFITGTQFIFCSIAAVLMYLSTQVLKFHQDRLYKALESPTPHLSLPKKFKIPILATILGVLVSFLIFIGLHLTQSDGPHQETLLTFCCLLVLIILYETLRTKNPFTPMVVSLTHFFLYLSVAMSITPSPHPRVIIFGLIMTLYLFFITILQRRGISSAFSSQLIAGACLLESLWLALGGFLEPSFMCIGFYFLGQFASLKSRRLSAPSH